MPYGESRRETLQGRRTTSVTRTLQNSNLGVLQVQGLLQVNRIMIQIIAQNGFGIFVSLIFDFSVGHVTLTTLP